MEEPIRVVAGVGYENGLYLIFQRDLNGRDPGLWEFPGGKVKKNEEPMQALVRELQEELGVLVRVNKFLCEIEVKEPRPMSISFWQVEWPKDQSFKFSEHLSSKWVSLEDLKSYSLTDADKEFVSSLAVR